MAMTMSGEYQLAVPRETVWEKLNDAETRWAVLAERASGHENNVLVIARFVFG